jgi:hypothetical protein
VVRRAHDGRAGFLVKLARTSEEASGWSYLVTSTTVGKDKVECWSALKRQVR